MPRHKSTLSLAQTYREVGEFWDSHDLADFRDKTSAASFDVGITSEVTYYAVDKELSERIRHIAQKRGIAADTLINLWVQEKLKSEGATDKCGM